MKLQKYLTPLWQLAKYGPSSENDFQNSDNEKMRPQKPATAFELQLFVLFKRNTLKFSVHSVIF